MISATTSALLSMCKNTLVIGPGRTVIRTVFLTALILVLTSAAWNLAATKYQHARNPVHGAFYNIEGRQMHICCTGSGPYTVLIEVGASADCSAAFDSSASLSLLAFTRGSMSGTLAIQFIMSR
jgi:hypothetical protein